MPHFILYTNPTSTTGRTLRDALGIEGGTTIENNHRPETLIRWGSSARIPLRPERVINSRNAVGSAADKYQSLVELTTNHVLVPTFYPANHVPYDPNIFPLLGRRVIHQQGTDIRLCLQRSDVERVRPEVDFFTKYIPCGREYRVHVFSGQVIKISEKILTDQEKFKVEWIRNFENGFTFRNPERIPGILKEAIEAAGIAAVQALNLDFGAVDVLLGDDGRAYVLEVNTGPGLADNSLEVYVRKFAEVLEIPEEDLVLPNRREAPEAMELPPEEELEELLERDQPLGP